MTKKEAMDDSQSCWNRAKDDEPVFILLGRDEVAPLAIAKWCDLRVGYEKNEMGDVQISEALDVCEKMRRYVGIRKNTMPEVLNIKNTSFSDVWEFDTMRIDRITPWGNPFIIGVHGDTREVVCAQHSEWLHKWIDHEEEITYKIGIRTYSNKWVIENLHLLRGMNVACWCAPDQCHGDLLVILANVHVEEG